MTQIIKITTQQIGTTEVNSVNARDVHEYLEVKTHLSTWIKRAIEKYDFIENVDFSILKSGNPNGGIDKIDYIVTLDMAKELCMIENNVKGKETRKYFIEVEKQAFKPKTLSLEDLLKANTQMITNLQNKVVYLETENKALAITNSMLMHTNKLYTATEIAKELGFTSANFLNKKLEDLKIQRKVNNCWVLNARYVDMGYTSTKQQILDNGKAVYDRKFTQKGREFILKLFPHTIIKKHDLKNSKVSNYNFKLLSYKGVQVEP